MSRLIATWFFIGYMPLIPGTWGSLASFPLFILAWALAGGGGIFIGALLIGGIGFWAISQGKGDDAPEIVVDEVLGQWIALMPIFFLDPAPLWIWFALAFVLFRLFDILKPWPIKPIEKLPGALGIMGDDILAGVFAALLLVGFFMLWGRWLGVA